ncbi:MAG: glycosyltransferase [Ferruginibacter sp.]
MKLFMVARFHPPKDHETLVRTLQHLPSHFHVLFAGDGAGLNKVKQVSVMLNVQSRVHFLGFRNDIPELMKSADVNILSSLHEGFSGVVTEALATGKPFLGSDVLGINDVVPDKSFLFEKEDHAALAKKILAITADRSISEHMAITGPEHVKNFDTNMMIKRHIDLYEELLRAAGKSM